jgi:tetratricopeptide (TPR) repeat protein
MRTTCTFLSVLAIFSALPANSIAAKDDPLDFLHLLQREGYSDVAVEYLDQLKSDPNAPKDIMDVWDLEMSKSKKAKAAEHAYSPGEAKQLAEESKALLDRFIKAHPNLPEAIQEKAQRSVDRALEAQTLVVRATYATDREEKAKFLADARKLFEEIRPQFAQAVEAARKLVISAGAKPSAKRDAAVIALGENRLNLAMIDFYMAQTQGDGPQRTAALSKLVKDFDGVYQDFREAIQDPHKAFLSWRAHFWHARILLELGKTREALDVFEEVTACDPRNIDEVTVGGAPASRGRPAKSAATGFEDFFAEVEQYYLQTLYRINKKDYLEEVESWRGVHKVLSEKCQGYQALTLEYAKNLLEMNNRSPTSVAKALVLLREMGQVPSPYQEDAIKLRRQLDPKGSAKEGFEDNVIDGFAAFDKRQWPEAAEFLEKAIHAKTSSTTAARLAEVEDVLVRCYYCQALELWQKGKVDDAVTTAKKALKSEYLQTNAAPKLAVLLLNMQNYQYQSATEDTPEQKKAKADLLEKVKTTAGGIVKVWAAKEEGDAARIVLMQLAQARDDVKEADRILREINTKSGEYPTALAAMGFAHWNRYRAAKKLTDAYEAQFKAENGKVATEQEKKDQAERIAKRDEDRTLAVTYSEKAVAALETLRPAGSPMSDTLRQCKLMLATIYAEHKDYKLAVPQYQGLVDDMLNKNSNRQFDETGLRIFEGAGQAYLQMGDAGRVAVVGSSLLEKGPDDQQVNRAIIAFTAGVDKLRKASVESDTGDPAAQDAAAAKLKTLTDLLEKMLISLSNRKKMPSTDMTWIAMTTAKLGTPNAKTAAAELIKKIIEKSNSDQAFSKQVEKALPTLESLAATLEAELGHYDQAQEMIERLIAKNPRILDPQISRAKILTAWAAKDPSKYGEAIAKWDTLRNKLPNSPAGAAGVNPKYDVIVNEADCFYKWSQKTKTKADAQKGLDLLTPYLNLDKNIRSPDDDYKEISSKSYQVGGKLADFLDQPRPARPPKGKKAL